MIDAQNIDNDVLMAAVQFANKCTKCVGADFVQCQTELATNAIRGHNVQWAKRWCDLVRAYYHGAMLGSAMAKQQQSKPVDASPKPIDGVTKVCTLPTVDDFLAAWAPKFGMTVRGRADVAVQLVQDKVAPLLAAKDALLASQSAQIAELQAKVVDVLSTVRNRVIHELDNKRDDVGHYRVRECDVVSVIDEAIKTANGSTIGQQVATLDDACADTPKQAAHNWRHGGTDNDGNEYFVGDANDLRLRATYNPKLGKWFASAARNGVDVLGTSGAASAEEAMSSMNALLQREPRWWLSGEESKKVTRAAYEQLVNEDLVWLLKQPRTLERDHIEAIVRASVDAEYPPRTTAAPPCGPCQGSGKLWDSNWQQFHKCSSCDGIGRKLRADNSKQEQQLSKYDVAEKDPAKRAEMVAACLNERGVLRGRGHPKARAEHVNNQHMVRFTSRVSHIVDLLEQEKITILQLAMEIEASDEAYRRGREMMWQAKKA